MKISERELQGLLPNLKGLSGIDPKAELRITEAFRRIYEFMFLKLNEQQNEFNKQLRVIEETRVSGQKEVTGLIGIFSQPLAGSNQSDPLLQNLIQSFGPQAANSFFAGPIPTFRLIAQADLPALDTTKIGSGRFPLTRLALNTLKTDDNLTKTVSSPIPDGTVLIKDNNGNSIKVCTTT